MAKGSHDRLRKAITGGDPEAWANARDGIEHPHLSGVDLAEESLADFDLGGADLTNADLSECDLSGATLDLARLEGADLTKAKLLDLSVEAASFQGASLDEVELTGTFVECDFRDTTWTGARAIGARFVRCNFADASFDMETFVGANRFEQCKFGERDDLPEDLLDQRPAFLRPIVLEGERIDVRKLELTFKDAKALKKAMADAVAEAGFEQAQSGVMEHEGQLYLGLFREEDVEELEEWIAFKKESNGAYTATELYIDPSFDTFLDLIVLPLVTAGGGDLDLVLEQDLEDRSAMITELKVIAGKPEQPKQYKRNPP